MSASVTSNPVPFKKDAEGVLRVGETRVTLDTIVGAFCDGATAEEIVQQYPSLHLGDVYLAIGYYPSHRDEVESYLRERESVALTIRQENERRFDPVGVRARLLARRRASG